MHFMLYFLISVIIIILSLIWLIKLWPSEENFEETKYLQTKDDMTTVVDCETYMPSTSCENLPTPTTSKMDLYNTPSRHVPTDNYAKLRSNLSHLLPSHTIYPDPIPSDFPTRYSPQPSSNGSSVGKLSPPREFSVEKQKLDLDEDEDVETIGDEEEDVQSETVLTYPKGDKNSCILTLLDLKTLAPHKMLNDSIIDFYLKYVHHNLQTNRLDKIKVFSSFFYGRLSQAPAKRQKIRNILKWRELVKENYQRLKTWTKDCDLFGMNYIVIPVNEELHWYLAIIVNPEAGLLMDDPAQSRFLRRMTRSKTNQGPFLVILDSMEREFSNYSIVCEVLAEYLHLESKEKRPGELFNRESLEVVIPLDVPQQKNNFDCGIFLLHFAECFLKKNPRTPNLSNETAFEDCFPEFEFPNVKKRKDIIAIITRLAPNLTPDDFTTKRKQRRL